MFIITCFQFFSLQNIFYKNFKLFLRSTEREDLQRSLLTRRVIMVKLNTSFLFSHKEVVVISLAFWVNFAFD